MGRLPAPLSHQAVKEHGKRSRVSLTWAAQKRTSCSSRSGPLRAPAIMSPWAAREKRCESWLCCRIPQTKQPSWTRTGYLEPSKVPRPPVAHVYSQGCRFRGGCVASVGGGATAQPPPMGRGSGWFDPLKYNFPFSSIKHHNRNSIFVLFLINAMTWGITLRMEETHLIYVI